MSAKSLATKCSGNAYNLESTVPNKKVQFPDRIYTLEEIRLAQSLIERGHRHRLRVLGRRGFREKAVKALKLIKTARYYDFLRTYIRRIVEVDGFSQLREVDLEIWANIYTVENAIEAASFLIQKAWQMRMYLDGMPHYDSIGEKYAVKKRLEFLETLARKSRDPSVKEECAKRLRLWDESKFL